ncbi:MAG: S8 family serine peptidase [Haliea sp.]
MKKLALAVAIAATLPLHATAQASKPAANTHIVVLKPGAAARGVAADVARTTGGRVGYVYEHALQGFTITVPEAALKGILRNPNVLSIEPDGRVQTMAQTIPTGINRIHADYSKLLINGNDDYRVDVDVAVLDTGIDVDHPDLNVVGGTNCLYTRNGPRRSRTVYCEDAAGGDDDQYHGTHVAGTIAALDNGIGVVGVAPGARLWAVKVLDAEGTGSFSGILAGIDWVVARGDIEVLNMSLGGAGSSSAMNQAVANAVASGVTVVVAAGNSNQDAAGFSPANAPDAITVSALADFDGLPGGMAAATCRSDQDDTLANFSNWGAVDIAAPGVCTYSTYPIEKGSYATISGTSMAAPHVAGAAALLASTGLGPNAIRTALLTAGNYDWTDTSGDGIQEPLLDISNFTPVFVANNGGGDNPGDPEDPVPGDPEEPVNPGDPEDPVNPGDPETGLDLQASGYKQRGFQYASLVWSGAASNSVDIYRDGSLLDTTANNGAYTDDINQKGGGSYRYSVCETGTASCSATVTVTF